MTQSKLISAILILSLALVISCKNTDEAETGSSGAVNGSSAQSGGSSEVDGLTATLAKLSDEDRVLAEKQKMCPVSDEALGSMGVPLKFTVNDQVVFVCCEGCKKPVEENPEKFLAKIKE